MIRKTFVALATAALLAGCASNSGSGQEAADNMAITTEAKQTLPSGLKYTVLTEAPADSRVAKKGETVSVHYTGWTPDGTKFDSSRDKHQPFEFKIGGGQVIQGWEQGVEGMKVGEKRKLVIPPDLGYGSRAVGPIPANSTLIFEVELLDIKQ